MTALNEDYTTPVDSPAYGPLPTIYRGVSFNYVYFTTDPGNIETLLPQPLKPCEEGLCAAFSIKVPFSSSYGAFNEMGVVVQAVFNGKKVFYLPALFLDNDSAIAAGREIYGSPKKYAQIELTENAGIFTGTCKRNGAELIRIDTKITGPLIDGDLPDIFPVYNLKMIPSITGSGPAIKQLTSTGVFNSKLYDPYLCSGTVQFNVSSVSGIHVLKPQKMIGASQYVMDYDQGYGEIVYDYLK
jgi:acetoacetate decarboxylase